MTLELVRGIREAEEKAEAMLKEARQAARQKLAEAQKQADDSMAAAMEAAEKKAGAIVEAAEKEAETETVPLLADKKSEAAALQERARQKMPEAVKLLTERVVIIDADN